MPKNIKYNNDGIAIVLVMGLLAALMGLGLVASNLVLRESASVSGIEQSEIAYYAAEAGAERRIYLYNKAFPRIPAIEILPQTCDNLTNNLEVITEARWKEIALALGTEANPWDVTIGNNQSFELSLDLEGVSYPNRLSVDRLNGGDSTVVVFQIDKVTSQETQNTRVGNPARVPGPGASDNFDFVNYYYRIKIGEENGGSVYSINMIGNPSIVTSVSTTVCGEYQNGRFERQAEITYPKWEIF